MRIPGCRATSVISVAITWLSLAPWPGAAQQVDIPTTPEITSPDAAFEVASIRPFAVDPGGPAFPRITTLPGGRLQAMTSVTGLIRFAYGLEPYHQVRGVPDELGRQLFEVVALAPLSAQQRDVPRAEHRRMMRTLLQERFQLRIRVTSELQNVLVLTRNNANQLGPGLRRLDGECSVAPAAAAPTEPLTLLQRVRSRCGQVLENGRVAGVFNDLAAFARFLSLLGSQTVVDETGLQGPFEIEMAFNPVTFGGLRSAVTENLPSLLDALRGELGLSLRGTSRSVPVLIVERVERPRDN